MNGSPRTRRRNLYKRRQNKCSVVVPKQDPPTQADLAAKVKAQKLVETRAAELLSRLSRQTVILNKRDREHARKESNEALRRAVHLGQSSGCKTETVPAPAASPSISSKWAAAFDPKTQRTYYHHTETREVRWTKPTGKGKTGGGHHHASAEPGRYVSLHDLDRVQAPGHTFGFSGGKMGMEKRQRLPPRCVEEQLKRAETMRLGLKSELKALEFKLNHKREADGHMRAVYGRAIRNKMFRALVAYEDQALKVEERGWYKSCPERGVQGPFSHAEMQRLWRLKMSEDYHQGKIPSSFKIRYGVKGHFVPFEEVFYIDKKNEPFSFHAKKDLVFAKQSLLYQLSQQ